MAATLKCDTIQNASSSTANLTLDASGNATVGNTLAMGSSFKRNRIINGDMRVDQRNAGASVTIGSGTTFTVDRWPAYGGAASKFSVQQNAGSITPPVGFSNYLGVTSLSSYTIQGSEEYDVFQKIEGLNISDLGWGTANAKSVTLSFWVRSSLTGTFGGSLVNSAANRSYVFPYSISSANTWTQISIVVPGDISGTWLSTNGTGITVIFSMGAATVVAGSANTWSSTYYAGLTGQVNLVSTNAATWYITGVQLETGSIATPYERQIYSDQLLQCQRYYEKSYDPTVVPGTASVLGNGLQIAQGALAGSTSGNVGGVNILPYKATKRAAPTLVFYDFDGTINAVRIYPADAKRSGITGIANPLAQGSFQFITFDNSSGTAISAGNQISINWTSSAEL